MASLPDATSSVSAVGRPSYPPPPLLEPAWYPDPTGRYEARYWDGRHWTSHISHYGATGTDPMLRARFDSTLLRIAGKVALWGVIVLAGWWAYSNYWPSDDRDTDAEAEVLAQNPLTVADVPATYASFDGTVLSPLVGGSDDDEASEAADDDPAEDSGPCAAFDDVASDAEDQPSDASGFRDPAGQSVTNQLFLGADQDFADDYLTALRGDAGPCLEARWLALLSDEYPNLSVTALSVRSMSQPSFGDDAVWWRLSGSLTGGAFPLQVSADVLVVRVDRAVSEYVFSGVGLPIGVDVQRDAIQPHSARLRAAVEALDAEDDADDQDDAGDDQAGEDAP